MMITYRLLSSNDLISLYECFLAAFFDYEVDMQMSLEHFQQRMVRDGVQLEISAAAFNEGKMIGFYMNARGPWRGMDTAYDAGTGVVPGFRKQGVSKELFAFLVPRLKALGITHYLLEVLTSNQAAVALYRKLGFVETRKLAVFRAEERVEKRGDLEGVVIRRVAQPDWKLFESFWDGYPSWQNSIDAVNRISSDAVIICAYLNDECVGYGIAFQPAVTLMQLAVAPAHRRRDIGSGVLSRLQDEFSETLKVNMIDEDLKETLAFFEANRFELVLEQFEMVHVLATDLHEFSRIN